MKMNYHDLGVMGDETRKEWGSPYPKSKGCGEDFDPVSDR